MRRDCVSYQWVMGTGPSPSLTLKRQLMECVWATVNTTKTTSEDICMSWMRQLCECCVHCTVIHLISGNAFRDQAEFKRNWKTWKSATQWDSLITAYRGPRKCFMACKGIWNGKKSIYIYIYIWMLKKIVSTVLLFKTNLYLLILYYYYIWIFCIEIWYILYTHIYIYIYIYKNVCVCIYIYIYIHSHTLIFN